MLLQVVCVALVICGAAAAAVGIALSADIGAKSGFLQDAACVDFGVWNCLPANASPNGCWVEAQTDGTATATLYCPSVRLAWVGVSACAAGVFAGLGMAVCSRPAELKRACASKTR